jgi:hypothetical protein
MPLPHPSSDSAGIVAELRRATAIFQLRAICTAMEIPHPSSAHASPTIPGVGNVSVNHVDHGI